MYSLWVLSAPHQCDQCSCYLFRRSWIAYMHHAYVTLTLINLDDIFVFSKSPGEHLQHSMTSATCMRPARLHAKFTECREALIRFLSWVKSSAAQRYQPWSHGNESGARIMDLTCNHMQKSGVDTSTAIWHARSIDGYAIMTVLWLICEISPHTEITWKRTDARWTCLQGNIFTLIQCTRIGAAKRSLNLLR